MSTFRRITLCVTAVAATAAAVALPAAQGVFASTAVTSYTATVTASDGVALKALVQIPATTGSHPLVVAPSPWGGAPRTYTVLTDAGFEVVSYAQRGFGGSGGAADLAGPASVADFSTVLDWSLANTSVTPGQIGALGMSYGATQSLLGAAADSRVKAVVAMSPWASLSTAFAPNGVLRKAALTATLTGATLTSDGQALRSDVASNPVAAVNLLATLSPSRSPLSVVPTLNARNVPVLLEGALQDTLISPSDVPALFAKLTGPKRMFLLHGDHGAALAPSALGPSGPWTAAVSWLQRYVTGASVSTAQLTPAVNVFDQNGVLQTGSSWPLDTFLPMALGTSSTITALSTAQASTLTWSTSLSAAATAADSAAPNLVAGSTYAAPTVTMSTISKTGALQWNTVTVGASLRLCGAPSFSASLTASSASASLFAYLYDVNASGVGTLVSTTPLAKSSLSRTTPTAVTLPLLPMCETVAAGHHLTVVVDGVDARFAPSTVAGTTLTFSSTASTPAALNR